MLLPQVSGAWGHADGVWISMSPASKYRHTVSSKAPHLLSTSHIRRWDPTWMFTFWKRHNHDGGDIQILKLRDGDGSLCVAPSWPKHKCVPSGQQRYQEHKLSP